MEFFNRILEEFADLYPKIEEEDEEKDSDSEENQEENPTEDKKSGLVDSMETINEQYGYHAIFHNLCGGDPQRYEGLTLLPFKLVLKELSYRKRLAKIQNPLG